VAVAIEITVVRRGPAAARAPAGAGLVSTIARA
jgi:hypothetical protein